LEMFERHDWDQLRLITSDRDRRPAGPYPEMDGRERVQIEISGCRE